MHIFGLGTHFLPGAHNTVAHGLRPNRQSNGLHVYCGHGARMQRMYGVGMHTVSAGQWLSRQYLS